MENRVKLYILLTGQSERKEGETRAKATDEIMAENFLDLVKDNHNFRSPANFVE